MSNLEAIEKPCIVVGAGGHGTVVADAMQSCAREVLGFVDPRGFSDQMSVTGLPLLGNDDALVNFDPKRVLLLNGIGATTGGIIRSQVQKRIEMMGYVFEGVRHPTATISVYSIIERCVQVMAQSVVQAGASVDRGTIINTGAVVEHGVNLDEFVHVAPNATICGDVSIGALSYIGAGSVIKQGVALGPRTIVAAGAVVVNNHFGGGVLTGVPAVVVKGCKQ